ncbi:uncharacterized protein SETTUDRAFT_165848, partial [Exserohilum turcica Et28A]
MLVYLRVLRQAPLPDGRYLSTHAFEYFRSYAVTLPRTAACPPGAPSGLLHAHLSWNMEGGCILAVVSSTSLPQFSPRAYKQYVCQHCHFLLSYPHQRL